MLVETVSSLLVRDNMCYTYNREVFRIQNFLQISEEKTATQWENGGDLIRDFKRRGTK